VLIDEISLWARPLAKETVREFGLKYISGSNQMQPAEDSLPPRQLALDATHEQTQGLPVHLLDAAAAHMELLAAYIRAEHAELYTECRASSTGPIRDRVIGRVGRAVRFVALAESDAADRLAVAGAAATPWRARYDAASRLLAGRRAQVVQELARVARCENPLGITADDLPLYHGEEVGESARFFASSRFLAREARAQVTSAQSELELARSAWQQQRASAFNQVLAAAEKAERVSKIEDEFEGALRKLCGAPASGTLVAGFRDGSLTASSCFLKLDGPCAGAQLLPLRSVPASCLRGEIGEQLLALVGAELDARNAEAAYDRAMAQYDAEMEYCTRREAHHQQSQAILEAHHEHMAALRASRRQSGLLAGLGRGIINLGAALITENPALAVAGVLDGYNALAGDTDAVYAGLEATVAAELQQVMQAREHALDLMACFHGADNQKFAIDAARDVIARAYHETKAAMLRLENLRAETVALANQAAGAIALEQSMVRVLPHHHFWLDDHIDAYRRHLRYARRLTYLAVRAFEYESQQTLGVELAVLTARTPVVLDQVVHQLEVRTAPMQGELGYVVGEFAPVMSVRDEILRLGTAQAPPGFPRLAPTEALRAYLQSDAAKIYANGEYLGRGIRFTLRPPSWAQFSCAERIWRITTALQTDTAPIPNARLVLWQENAFASQRCRSNERDVMHVARVRPEHNLLVGDDGNFDGTAFVRPLRYTAMETTGLGNLSREQLSSLPAGLHSGFAGRGLYASYVLLFPSAQFDNPAFLTTVRDVLLRFDIVSVTDVPDPD
jgi:hypothetical protein